MYNSGIFRKNLLFSILLLLVGIAFTHCRKHTEIPDRDPRGVFSFTHPGILNTQASLNFMQVEVNTPGSWRAEMFKNTVDGYIDQYYNTSIAAPFPATVTVKSNGSTDTERRFRIDAQLAYALALKWAVTADTVYAAKAINLLNGWAYTFSNIDTLKGSPFKQVGLEAAWVIPSFTAAAEIMTYYEIDDYGTAHWAEKDRQQFKSFITKLTTSYSDKIFEDATNINNWYVSAAYARMCVAAYLNEASLYNDGYEKMKWILTRVITSDGIVPEYCYRQDCSHFQYSVTGVTFAAELDRIQSRSDELYNFSGQRLRKAYEYTRNAYAGSADCSFCTPQSAIYPGTAVANRFFNDDATAYITTLQQPPFGVTNDKTFTGFTMVTHYKVPL